MGYTHYWRRTGKPEKWAAAWPQVVECAKKIVEAATKDGIRIVGPDDDGGPIISDTMICLNGNPSFETFNLMPKLRSFQCTKTEMRPDDVVVTAILLCAAVLGEDGIRVESDGEWEEWIAGRELVNKLFPEFELNPELIGTDS